MAAGISDTLWSVTDVAEMADGLADVFVVPAEAVNPANNKRVAAAEQVEQAAPWRSLAELGADAGDATV